MHNRKLLDALERKNRGRPPIWIMRQAGRYLPSYRALRERYSLYTLFTEPELIQEVTLLPLREFPFDAAIVFSDITIVALSLGLSLSFQEGPQVSGTLLPPRPAGEALPFLAPAIRSLKTNLTVPLIGFVGGPYTVSTYLNNCPLPPLTEALIDLMDLQIDAGVDAIQIFETTPNPETFPYLKKLIDHGKRRNVPVILFAKGSAKDPLLFSALEPTALSCDWERPLSEVRAQCALPLQGNLHPEHLLSTPEQVRQSVRALLDSMKEDPAWVLNLGHGIRPQTPLSSVEALFSTTLSI